MDRVTQASASAALIGVLMLSPVYLNADHDDEGFSPSQREQRWLEQLESNWSLIEAEKWEGAERGVRRLIRRVPVNADESRSLVAMAMLQHAIALAGQGDALAARWSAEVAGAFDRNIERAETPGVEPSVATTVLTWISEAQGFWEEPDGLPGCKGIASRPVDEGPRVGLGRRRLGFPGPTQIPRGFLRFGVVIDEDGSVRAPDFHEVRDANIGLLWSVVEQQGERRHNVEAMKEANLPCRLSPLTVVSVG